MSEPLEIIAAPFTVWVAPVGTAFPFVNVAPLEYMLRCVATRGSDVIVRAGVMPVRQAAS